NAGAAAARGEWLVFTDDDCLPADGWLAAYERAFASGHDVYEGRTTCEAGLTSPRLTAPVNLAGGNLWSCNFAIRRNVFAALGGFDERFPYPHMEDADFRDRVVAAGHHIRFVPEATVDHPPRRLPWGTRLARIHRASVLYMVLHPPKRSLVWFVRKEIHMRLRSVIGTRKSLDTLSALTSLPVELMAIATQWRAWHSWARRVAGR
ncbi:MAG: glycosyltransferase, partial [Gemmatimonadaceae bacterium]|nr:glycosyltransferase [Gemmatimonadaceae bacterium]